LPNFNGLNADIADTYSTNKDDEKFEYQKRCFTGSGNIRNNSYDNQKNVTDNNTLDLLFVLWFPVILIVIFMFILTFIRF
jgi:ATP-dependent Zn protease